MAATNKDPMLAVANSPLFKLALETREEIYRLIVTDPHIVEIGLLKASEAKFRDERFKFRLQSRGKHASQIRKFEDCYHGGEGSFKSDRKSLDMALFLTSKVVANEVLSVILREHIIDIEGACCVATPMLNAFGSQLSSLRRLILHPTITDGPLCEETLSTLRLLAKSLVGLQTLTIHAKIEASGPGHRIDQRSLLNYFRPLSRLPITKAVVQMKILYPLGRLVSKFKPLHGDPQALRDLEARSSAILLKDCELPEEAQVDRPQKHLIAMEVAKRKEVEKKEAKKKAAEERAKQKREAKAAARNGIRRDLGWDSLEE